MNRNFAFALRRLWLLLVVNLCFAGANVASAGDHPKFESLLVWATNNEKPESQNYKPVDEETRKNLESLGLKWKHFYEVKRVAFEAPNGESGKVAISEKSSISVKVLKDKKVEVVFYGKDGKECSRSEQTIKPGKMIVHGGNVPENATAWLVTLKQLK